MRTMMMLTLGAVMPTRAMMPITVWMTTEEIEGIEALRFDRGYHKRLQRSNEIGDYNSSTRRFLARDGAFHRWLSINRCCAFRCATARGAAAWRLARARKSCKKLSGWSGRCTEPAETSRACDCAPANYCELLACIVRTWPNRAGSRFSVPTTVAASPMNPELSNVAHPQSSRTSFFPGP